MAQSKSTGSQNKQSGDTGMESKASPAKARSGKDAASHTKADTGKGAGGGKKQKRNH